MLHELFEPPIVVSGRATQEVSMPVRQVEQHETVLKSKEPGRDYVKQYIQAEEELCEAIQLKRTKVSQDKDSIPGPLSEISETTLNSGFDEKLNIYDTYSFDKRDKTSHSLPVFNSKEKILNAIETHRVIIIKGDTGCGKTTQIPQFILDSSREKRVKCKIVVTQPRRIAAKSIATRVCEERKWRLGQIVGYQIGQDKVASDDTCILYCTTGVLLEKLIATKHLQEFTHVILDEVHERDQDMDFLLIVVRKLLRTNSGNVRVILMSATIETHIFSEYFYSIYGGKKHNALVHDIEGEKRYKVEKFFNDNIEKNIIEVKSFCFDKPEISKKAYIAACRIVMYLDKIDQEDKDDDSIGTVLIFLPGLHEIEEMYDHLNTASRTYMEEPLPKKKTFWHILPLHSTLTLEEQDSIFKNPPKDHRKIILSTNIAESSLTIPNVKFVIDFCLTKVLQTDVKTNFTSLQLAWASKSSLEQRAGRAGRVRAGRVYRLISREFYETLDEDTPPEMTRAPLDKLVLQAKMLDMGEPKAIFALALSPPDLRNIAQTILSLKEMGALLCTVNNKYQDYDGDLTRLGRFVAKLPIDVRLGKLIFFGNLFGVLNECVVIACSLSGKSIFCSPFKEQLRHYESKLMWADTTMSDCIANFNVYHIWRKKRYEGDLRNKSTEYRWAAARFVQIRVLYELDHLCQEVHRRIKYSDFTIPRNSELFERKSIGKDIIKPFLIKLAIAAAFYPNYFYARSVDEKDAVNELCLQNPHNTVYLQNFPSNQPKELYKRSIAKEFEKLSSHIDVTFDSGSKVFVTFGHTSNDINERKDIPGPIEMAVYKAVKIRQSKPDVRIKMMHPYEALNYFNSQKEKIKNQPMNTNPYTEINRPFFWPWNKEAQPYAILPVLISYVESPSNFWIVCSEHKSVYEKISNYLAKPGNLQRPVQQLNVNDLYAVKIKLKHTKKTFFRCRIKSVMRVGERYNVYLVDYGLTAKDVSIENIFQFTRELCAETNIDKVVDLAYRCSLSKIRPPPHPGKWSKRAIEIMREFSIERTKNGYYAEVYSVMKEFLIVQIKESCGPKNTPIISNKLVTEGQGEAADESYYSKSKHMEFKQYYKMRDEEGIHKFDWENNLFINKVDELQGYEVEPPDNECTQTALLKGPFSPLEMSICGVTQCAMSKNIKIDQNSVNSVLLDTRTVKSIQKMIVAGTVSTNVQGDRLNLRDTTVFPSIPNLFALVCLMFSPMVELRRNSTGTNFSGALCGLGYKKSTRQSLYPENDMEIEFPYEIMLDHICTINKIRYWLSKAVSPQMTLYQDNLAEGQERLVKYISELCMTKWYLQILCYNANAGHWGLVPETVLLNPCNQKIVCHPADDFDSVYRLIWGIKLNTDFSAEAKLVRKNIDGLKTFSLGLEALARDYPCYLCQETIPDCNSAVIHRKSFMHKSRVKRFFPNEYTKKKENRYNSYDDGL